MIICLGQELLPGSGELLLTEIQDEINLDFCFVLAPNKDLAVSFLHFCKTIPEGMPDVSIRAVSVRTSHLTMDGC